MIDILQKLIDISHGKPLFSEDLQRAIKEIRRLRAIVEPIDAARNHEDTEDTK